VGIRRVIVGGQPVVFGTDVVFDSVQGAFDRRSTYYITTAAAARAMTG